MRFIVFLLVFFVTLPVFAQTPNTIRTGAAYVQLIQGSVQRILPGIPQSPIRYEYDLILLWKSIQTPDSFLFYNDNTWRRCTCIKNMNKIKKGDKIELTPAETINEPKELDKYTPKNNTIFFKTKKSGWLYITVKKLIKKPDVAMP